MSGQEYFDRPSAPSLNEQLAREAKARAKLAQFEPVGYDEPSLDCVPTLPTIQSVLDSAINRIREAHNITTAMEDSINPMPCPGEKSPEGYPCGIEAQAIYLTGAIADLNARLDSLRCRL